MPTRITHWESEHIILLQKFLFISFLPFSRFHFYFAFPACLSLSFSFQIEECCRHYCRETDADDFSFLFFDAICALFSPITFLFAFSLFSFSFFAYFHYHIEIERYCLFLLHRYYFSFFSLPPRDEYFPLFLSLLFIAPDEWFSSFFFSFTFSLLFSTITHYCIRWDREEMLLFIFFSSHRNIF